MNDTTHSFLVIPEATQVGYGRLGNHIADLGYARDQMRLSGIQMRVLRPLLDSGFAHFVRAPE